MSAAHACGGCGRTDVRALYPCTGCGDARARYCGEACQELAWNAGHALACGPHALVSHNGAVDARVLRQHVAHAVANAASGQAELVELGQELCQAKLRGPEDIDDALWFLSKVDLASEDADEAHRARLEAHLEREYPRALIPHNPIKYEALCAELELLGRNNQEQKDWLRAERAKRAEIKKQQLRNLRKTKTAAVRSGSRDSRQAERAQVRSVRKGGRADRRNLRARERKTLARQRRQLRRDERAQDKQLVANAKRLPPSGIRYRLESHVQAAKPRDMGGRGNGRSVATALGSSSDEEVLYQ